MPTPEGKYKIELKEELDKVPEIWYHITADALKSGIPDVLVALKRFAAIEAKVDAKLEPLQRLTLLKIRRNGALSGELRKVSGGHRWTEPLTVTTDRVTLFPTLADFRNYVVEQCK